jgi:hypothetical protein
VKWKWTILLDGPLDLAIRARLPLRRYVVIDHAVHRLADLGEFVERGAEQALLHHAVNSWDQG